MLADRRTDKHEEGSSQFSNAPKNGAHRKTCCVLVQNQERKNVLGREMRG